jgi:large subunit ribosomal protein L10
LTYVSIVCDIGIFLTPNIMAVTRQQKEEALKELIDKFSRSKSVVFADYRGLTVAGISDLRGRLRKGNAEMKVAKKTLMGLAAKEQKIEDLGICVMEGPVAATFSYEDPLAGIKVLFKFSKENDKLKLLGGIIDGKPVGPDIIEKYAKLPGREELLAKLVGSMNAPVSGFVGVLGNILGGFVRVLDAYKKKLPQEPVKAEAKETPVAETVKAEPAPETPIEEMKGESETKAV